MSMAVDVDIIFTMECSYAHNKYINMYVRTHGPVNSPINVFYQIFLHLYSGLKGNSDLKAEFNRGLSDRLCGCILRVHMLGLGWSTPSQFTTRPSYIQSFALTTRCNNQLRYRTQRYT